MNKKSLFLSLIFIIVIISLLFFLSYNKKEQKPENTSTYCTEEFKPVCGDNDVTYENTCKALMSGVGIKKNSSCESVMSEKDINNATYNILAHKKYVKLNNGIFNEEIDDKTFIAGVLEDNYTFGDLDGDNIDEAAVIVYSDCEGQRTLELAIMSSDDKGLIYWAGIPLENIVSINNFIIKDRIIILNLDKFKLEGTKLIKQ